MNEQARRSVQIEIRGVVQGVGFRPFVYRIATARKIAGWVCNHDHGVTVVAEGGSSEITAFLAAIRAEAPPASHIASLEVADIAPENHSMFEIRESPAGGKERYTPVSPDLALCADCRREIWDTSNRRYFYPFNNCTNCGPRLTITESVPYDRSATTMKIFKMCEACRREYENPADRRFHAQPVACPECGPRIWLSDAKGRTVNESGAETVIAEAVKALQDGKILAVKGLGGFHLMCDARSDEAVAKLRERKHRERKALAVLFPSYDHLLKYATCTTEERRWLESSAAPIVLLERRVNDLARGIAPGLRDIGAMLPYTPLHELLVGTFGAPLVATSGNRTDEPIAHTNDGALEKLHGIADLFLLHDREIHIRCDDSVMRIIEGKPYWLRRARGVVPGVLRVPGAFAGHVLATGAHLKNTVCVARDGDAIVSHHIGDLDNLATRESFDQAVTHYRSVFNVKPEIIAHDLHPAYESTKWAEGRTGELREATVKAVQHHHAHIVACAAENGMREPVLGLALDGTGYGPDGTIWGGEILISRWDHYSRVGRLAQIWLPGGERAVREPWRAALAYLTMSGISLEQLATLPVFRDFTVSDLKVLECCVKERRAGYVTSSCGRLFDAMSALTGLVGVSAYEGHAAIELEAAMRSFDPKTDSVGRDGYPFSVRDAEGIHVLDWRPMIREAWHDVKAGESVGMVSWRFHRGLAVAFASLLKRMSMLYKIETVALSGGCFMNVFLLAELVDLLREDGLKVLTHSKLPPNDGCISFGQAVVADAMVSAGKRR